MGADDQTPYGGIARLMILEESCHNGPCPTLHRKPASGKVKVQGYVTGLDGEDPPDGEDTVAIPADAWARLLADLPVGTLRAAGDTGGLRPPLRLLPPGAVAHPGPGCGVRVF